MPASATLAFASTQPPRAFSFTPDIGVAVFTLSALLIFFELNRPGRIIPGMLGLTGLLLAVNSWRQWQLRPTALILLALAAILPLWQLRRRSASSWMLMAAILFALGFFHLVGGPGAAHVHLPVAALCGLILGSGASYLARIAFRARQNKGLN